MSYVYKKGDAVDTAYMLVSGGITVSLDESHTSPINTDRMIIGTLEFFLKGVYGYNKKRLFDCLKNKNTVIKNITFTTLSKALLEYDVGYNSNLFLANLVDFSKDYYLDVIKKLSSDNDDYHKLAKTYVNILQELAELENDIYLDEYTQLINTATKEELFAFGLSFLRKPIYTTLSINPSTASSFVVKFSAGTVICKAGESAWDMFVLLSGTIGVYAQGRHITDISKSGEVIGELSIFLEGKRTATMKAETDTHVLFLNRNNLKIFQEKHPKIFVNIAKTLALRVFNTMDKTHQVLQLKESADMGLVRKKFTELEEKIKSLITQTDNTKLTDIYNKFKPVFEGKLEIPEEPPEDDNDNDIKPKSHILK
jgi:CRP-like cAMP-binding protein